MPHKLRKSQLIDYDNAAAGHPGVLSDKTGSMLVKPCKQPEIDFYQAAEGYLELKYYMPQYMGVLQLNQEATEAAAQAIESPVLGDPSTIEQLKSTGVAPVTEAWKPSAGAPIKSDCGLVLENVAHGFKKPNIMDVKLGARLWDDDAEPKKREKLDSVSAQTTSGSLGFRIAGMKVYVGKTAEPLRHDTKGYRKYDKDYGRLLNAENVHSGFEKFFFEEDAGITTRIGRRVIKRCLLELRELVKVLESVETRMYSASLLFVYEGDGDELARCFETESKMLNTQTEVGNGEPAMIDTEPTVDEKSQGGRIEDGVDGEEDEDSDDSELDAATRLPKILAVKMIDFAHAHFVKGEGPDENVLRGIRSLIEVLEKLTKQ